MRRTKASSNQIVTDRQQTLDSRRRRRRRHDLTSVIKEGILDLSSASEFYRRTAAVTTERKGSVEELEKDHYRLMGDFARCFAAQVAMRLENDRRPTPDAVAAALFDLALDWAEVPEKSTKKHSKRWLLRKWKSVERQFRNFCRSGYWRSDEWSYTVRNDWSLVESERPESDDISLSIAVDFAQTAGAKIMIGMTGLPMALLVESWMHRGQLKPPETLTEADQALNLFDSITREVGFRLGLPRRKRGRPRAEKDKLAAYLHWHEKKTLRDVAKALGLITNGRPIKQAKDLAIKHAENYFKSLRKQFRSPMRTE